MRYYPTRHECVASLKSSVTDRNSRRSNYGFNNNKRGTSKRFNSSSNANSSRNNAASSRLWLKQWLRLAAGTSIQGLGGLSTCHQGSREQLVLPQDSSSVSPSSCSTSARSMDPLDASETKKLSMTPLLVQDNNQRSQPPLAQCSLVKSCNDKRKSASEPAKRLGTLTPPISFLVFVFRPTRTSSLRPQVAIPRPYNTTTLLGPPRTALQAHASPPLPSCFQQRLLVSCPLVYVTPEDASSSVVDPTHFLLCACLIHELASTVKPSSTPALPRPSPMSFETAGPVPCLELDQHMR